MASSAVRATAAKSLLAQVQAQGGRVAAASPLLAQLYGLGGAIGGQAVVPLPRDLNGASSLGPDNPMSPSAIDPSLVGTHRPAPRVNQVPAGYNLPSEPGAQKLVPFRVLRTLPVMYDVLARCIQIRKDEIATLDWDVIPREDASQAKGRSRRTTGRKKPGVHDVLRTERKALRQYFNEPDREQGYDWRTWISLGMDEMLVPDAVSIWEQPSLGSRAGVLGSDLLNLQFIDGTTIKPLVTPRGVRPAAPNVAYQQFLWGIPRAEMVAAAMSMDPRDDINVQHLQRGLPSSRDDAETYNMSADQLIYKPMHVRSWTPYGNSPIEQIIRNVSLALKRQAWHDAYFTDGDIPAMLIHVPDTWNLSQIQLFEGRWHAMLAGDNGWKHRMRAIPGVNKAEQLKPPVHDMNFDEWLARITCAGLGVDPFDVNIGSKTEGESAAAAIRDKRYRQTILPSLVYWQWIIDNVIARRIGQPDLTFRFSGLEAEDEKTQMEIDTAMVKIGAMSLNEFRAKWGMDPLDFPQADEPNVYLTRDVVPLSSVGVYTLSTDQLDVAEGKPPGGSPSPAPAVGGRSNPNGPGASATPRASGASASGGSATNAKRSPSAGKNSTSKFALALRELSSFERFVAKSRSRNFRPDVLPQDLVDRVYERLAEGEAAKEVFKSVRSEQKFMADMVVGELFDEILSRTSA